MTTVVNKTERTAAGVRAEPWPHDLPDPAAKLRAQADRLDHEVRRQLVAARADWTAHHL